MADLRTGNRSADRRRQSRAAKQTVGVIREIGDGVAKVEGLADVMLNEMLDFGQGITGLALNLDETEVGVIILGDYTKLQEGDEVRAHGEAAAGARSARVSSAGSSTRSESRSMERDRSPATSPIR